MARIYDYVEFWREKAEQLRADAARVGYPEMRENLLTMAAQWDELAARFKVPAGGAAE
jgi:hypothetical protein